MDKMNHNDFEAIIIGGSYSGLSAALTLGRSLRKTLIIDAGKPCNRQTPHSHNFLTHDGSEPKAISSLAKDQLRSYPTVSTIQGLVTSGRKINDTFELITSTGLLFHGKKLVISTGIKDVFPEIKGFQECWGISVIHCPYCHGYEVRHKKTVIMAEGDEAFHLSSLVHNLTDDLMVISSGEAEFTTEQLSVFQAKGIELIKSKVIEIIHEQGQVSSLFLENGQEVSVEAMYARIPTRQHADLPSLLGCELTEAGRIKVNEFQKTTVAGVFASGDCTTPFRSVATAVAAGHAAGAFINGELCAEQFHT